ncbi:MAG TPA: MotA/TolQ/ExbB proton channel family protein [Planctomycetota bacterium]|nr:MotA/TolQ/ExbB proton channel family protein [Planctomycetota bacterium]
MLNLRARRNRWVFSMLLGMIALAVCGQTLLAAQPATGPAQPVGDITLWTMIRAGGVVGFAIILLSLVAAALIVEDFLVIRRERLLPDSLIEEVHGHLEQRNWQEAQRVCAEDGSFIAAVVGGGLNQIGSMFGFFDMQNAMQEVSERQVSKLYRRLDYLSFIAAAAPMLGLLGTVTGMIHAFREIAKTEGTAKPSQLAGGISEALITTAEGLVVAIPVMFFIAFFRNRIDSIVAEAETAVEKLMGRFRKENPL